MTAIKNQSRQSTRAVKVQETLENYELPRLRQKMTAIKNESRQSTRNQPETVGVQESDLKMSKYKKRCHT